MNERTMNDRIRMHKKPIAEINIVPYVDVMLVLLIIFMATAPMLTQGVQVDLPSAKAEMLPHDQKPPLVISVNAKGDLFLDQSHEAQSPEQLTVKVKAALKRDPNRSVLVKGDKNVQYGQVMTAMVILKRAGAPKVGLMTQHVETNS